MQNDLNLCSFRMFEGTFSLDAAHVVSWSVKGFYILPNWLIASDGPLLSMYVIRCLFIHYCAFNIFQKVVFCLELYKEVNLQTFAMI